MTDFKPLTKECFDEYIESNLDGSDERIGFVVDIDKVLSAVKWTRNELCKFTIRPDNCDCAFCAIIEEGFSGVLK